MLKRAITVDGDVAIAVVSGRARAIRLPWTTRMRGRIYLRTARVADRRKNANLGAIVGSAELKSASLIVPSGEASPKAGRGRYVWVFENPTALRYPVEYPGVPRRKVFRFDDAILGEPSVAVRAILADMGGSASVSGLIRVAESEGLEPGQVFDGLTRLFFMRRLACEGRDVRLLNNI